MYHLQRRANKYGAKKKEFNGRIYDSKGEAGVAQELEVLARAGVVIKIEPQQTYPLYGKNGSKICSHRVDFIVTFNDGHKEAWEYKGFATQEWKIKRDLFVDNYPDILYVTITSKGNYYGNQRRNKRNN